MNDLIKFLFEKHIVENNSIEGYSNSEIEKYETSIGIRFPRTYCDYLLAMGKKSGFLFDHRAGIRLEFIEDCTKEFLRITKSAPREFREKFKTDGFLFHYNIDHDLFAIIYPKRNEEDPRVYYIEQEWVEETSKWIEVDSKLTFSKFLWVHAELSAEGIQSYFENMGEYPAYTRYY